MKLKTMIFAALTAGLAACSNSDDAVETGKALQVDAQIADATTRLGIGSTTFGENESIGVYLSGTTTQYVYTADSAGKLSSENPYYFGDNSRVGFCAYYPYSADTDSNGNVEVSTATQSDALDKMFASEVNTSVVTSSVNFTFRHKMSKISILLVSDGTFTSSDAVSATLSGLCTVGTFNTLTGGTSTNADSKEAIAASVAAPSAKSASSNAIATAEAIILPQTPDGKVVLNLTINSIELKVVLPITKLESGYNYTFTAKATTNSPLSVSPATIAQWSEGFSEYVWEEMEYQEEK
jgi:phosphohistidine swiveling domain-containing protein